MPQHAFDPSRRPQIAIAPGSLHTLRAALAAAAPEDAARVLQEAGYASGVGHALAFRDLLAASGEQAPEALPVPTFQARVAELFASLGWGRLTVDAGPTAISVVETGPWAEWEPRDPSQPPNCHFSTGMFAGFFGTLAEHPFAVLEVDPDEPGREGCRFLVGNVAVMEHLFGRLEAGAGVSEALAELG